MTLYVDGVSVQTASIDTGTIAAVSAKSWQILGQQAIEFDGSVGAGLFYDYDLTLSQVEQISADIMAPVRLKPRAHFLRSTYINPGQISTVDAWYDPTDDTELTAPAGIVENMDNQIGGSTPVLNQGDSGKRPDVNGVMGPNGLQCLTFEGANQDQMEVAASGIARTAPYEIWFAAQIDENLGSLLQHFIDGDVSRCRVMVSAAGATQINAGTVRSGTDWPTDGLPHIVRVLIKGTTSQMWLDDVSFIGPVDAGTDNLTDLVIGANQATSFPLYGRMADIFISDDEMAAQQVSDMWTYMQQKWTAGNALRSRQQLLIPPSY